MKVNKPKSGMPKKVFVLVIVVDEVKEWTEPGNGNQKVVRVSYTWKLADVPSWVDKSVLWSERDE